jgi:hypothetical protein
VIVIEFVIDSGVITKATVVAFRSRLFGPGNRFQFLGGGFPRHFVPGYDRVVPLGQQVLNPR